MIPVCFSCAARVRTSTLEKKHYIPVTTGRPHLQLVSVGLIFSSPIRRKEITQLSLIGDFSENSPITMFATPAYKVGKCLFPHSLAILVIISNFLFFLSVKRSGVNYFNIVSNISFALLLSLNIF